MRKKFVGQEEELQRLEFEYRRLGGSLVTIYGRRRVGKTRLVHQFLQGTPLAGRILITIVVALSGKPLREEALQKATGIPSVSPYLSLLQRLGVCEPDPEFSKT